MNSVDYLLENRFSAHSLQEKIEIKRLGPHRPDNVVVEGKANQNRKFSNSWYDKAPWLTASTTKKALFCFPCLLLGNGDNAWRKTGYTDLIHLSRSIKAHEKNAAHLTCCVRLELLGNVNICTQLDDAYRSSIRKHNQLVDKNRHVLSKLIDCVKFCGAFELALRGHNETPDSENAGIFRGLVDLVAELDGVLAEHLDTATTFKGTSKTIQNELLQCMYEVYLDHVESEIEQCNFISVQADETTDVSCKCQVVIVIRYTLNGEIKERFMGFQEAKEKHADALTKIITDVLCKYNVKNKLIAQTYDGAATMKGRINGVQAQIRKDYPLAYFVHCYAHQLNLVMEQACSKNIRKCKIFFANLAGFSVFFTSSPKRSSQLKEFCAARIPRAAQTRWNFTSRVVNTVYENKDGLLSSLIAIRDGLPESEIETAQHTHFNWDAKTISEAAGLIKWLLDDEFMFLLEFFHRVMPHVDILYAKLQKRNISVDEVDKAVQAFIRDLKKLRSEIDSISVTQDEDQSASNTRKRRRDDMQSLKSSCKEACDTMIVQATDRFTVVGNLIPLQLVDPTSFSAYAANFPDEKFEQVAVFYPMIVKEKLKTELTVLYSSSEFQSSKSSLSLLQFLIENNLKHHFSEVCQLLEISLTTPLVSAESERCFSTLGRIKTFLRNTMTNERLNALAALSIQKSMIRDIANFNQLVINKFAAAKNRRAEFLYKTCSRPEPDDE
ncbi:zinc finger MYM-type protein 1-like [Amphiura filiformis]|uniref:zinc finger MYM-type protein 1-like n=1 Tax=Amphiura filiformis TaxID=82378 RepID=UPI003B215D43